MFNIGRLSHGVKEADVSHSNRSSESRSPGQHHGDLRRALLKAAMEEIEASDGAAPSLRAVARRAGVSPGAPYHHFKGKAGLMAAVAMDGFVKLGEQQQLALSEQSAPGAQLKRCALGMFGLPWTIRGTMRSCLVKALWTTTATKIMGYDKQP
ncbi:MAG: helix-turn-helix domain-containing protein [Myxococcota bacterium]